MNSQINKAKQPQVTQPQANQPKVSYNSQHKQAQIIYTSPIQTPKGQQPPRIAYQQNEARGRLGSPQPPPRIGIVNNEARERLRSPITLVSPQAPQFKSIVQPQIQYIPKLPLPYQVNSYNIQNLLQEIAKLTEENTQLRNLNHEQLLTMQKQNFNKVQKPKDAEQADSLHAKYGELQNLYNTLKGENQQVAQEQGEIQSTPQPQPQPQAQPQPNFKEAQQELETLRQTIQEHEEAHETVKRHGKQHQENNEDLLRQLEQKETINGEKDVFIQSLENQLGMKTQKLQDLQNFFNEFVKSSNEQNAELSNQNKDLLTVNQDLLSRIQSRLTEIAQYQQDLEKQKTSYEHKISVLLSKGGEASSLVAQNQELLLRTDAQEKENQRIYCDLEQSSKQQFLKFQNRQESLILQLDEKDKQLTEKEEHIAQLQQTLSSQLDTAQLNVKDKTIAQQLMRIDELKAENEERLEEIYYLNDRSDCLSKEVDKLTAELEQWRSNSNIQK